jgi:GT2 family glycosyltransferase
MDHGNVLNRAVVPILSVSMNVDPKSYTQRLLRSIDFPVGLVIVQIGNADSTVVSAIIASLNSTLHTNENILSSRLTVLPHNPGSARCFNFGLSHLLAADHTTKWVLHVNNDVAFYPGVLRNIHRATEKCLHHDEKFGIGFTSLCCGGEWSAVVFARRMVEAVGLFDENFYPAYYEDG